MKKLGVVITDGVGFRNFVLTDFISEAQQQYDEVVLLSFLPASIYANINSSIRVIELAAYDEHFVNWFFRKAKELAHLTKNSPGNFGITDNLNANRTKSNTPRGFATRLLFKITQYFHSESWISWYQRLQNWSFSKNKTSQYYQKLLKEEGFTTLFFTHQRPPYIAPLVYQAQKIKIKTVSYIFSWDNLASKGRMAADFDGYLVWSDLMKKDLLQFYENVNNQQIQCVGAPQFEPYVLARYAQTKEAFCRSLDLDTEKPIICFSCGDMSTSKNDELYIQTIAEAIQNGRIVPATLLVRTSPAEDPIRFETLVKQFPDIRWHFPKWQQTRHDHQEAWSQRVPTVEDIIDLRAILRYSALNINMLSTMSLDFMHFDKPVINSVFGNDTNGLYNDQRFLKYAHIQHLVQSGATRVVTNENQLIEAINTYLKHPELDAENRQQLLRLQIGKPLQGTSQRIVEALKTWN
ncbi:MAG: hypothetical protein CFE24_10430 [Flavobacterium sp. BFFFF2]|nr:MAG: hypothetical protein CFE24_10430 [Flavobacterium sp. BFFFF2]